MCDVPVVFVSPELQGLISRLNINLIEPSAYDKLRAFMSVTDLGFSLVLDEQIRKHLQFQALGQNSQLLACFKTNTSKQFEIENHIRPIINSEVIKAEVLSYIQGNGENLNMMGEESKFNLSTSHGVLVVGVQHGFFNLISDKDSLKDFYRNCLELCQSTIPGANLNNSSLFSQFVKLSISF